VHDVDSWRARDLVESSYRKKSGAALNLEIIPRYLRMSSFIAGHQGCENYSAPHFF